MTYKTKSELQEEIDQLRRINLSLKESLELKQLDCDNLREQFLKTDRVLGNERHSHFTTRTNLEAETNGLRAELAQCQSALYTLINKLPETL